MDRADGAGRAVTLYRDRHGQDPHILVRSPGRVNLIGEHTDYNDGFVLPAAIDRSVWVAAAAHDAPVVDVASEGFDPVRVRVDDTERPQGWGVYPFAVAGALRAAGLPVTGWRGAIASDLPSGAGLSSSAALELALARTFHGLTGFDWDPLVMARIAQRVENEWIGVASGIMDQVACAAGRDGHALLLDCRSLDIEPIAVPDDVVLLVLDSATRRELSGSQYNDRRTQCEEAARALGVAALRDVTTEQLAADAGALTPSQHRLARHVVTENARTLETARALQSGDVGRVGALLNEGHRSLRDDFEVSSPALDALTAAARAVDGCHGARLTGGGFGGCAIALVDADAAERVATQTAARYAAETGRTAPTYVCRASAGTSHRMLTGGS